MIAVPVKGYEGLYSITEDGCVMRNGRIRVVSVGNAGYSLINLSKNNKCKTLKVHRLVAEAFIPNPDNKPQVNHIDEDKLNNKVSNLEWVTCQENGQHSAKLTSEQVRGMLFDFSYGLTDTAISKIYGVSRSSINLIRNGKTWANVTGIGATA